MNFYSRIMRLLYLPVNSVCVACFFDNSLNIQALLVCPAMSGPASLSVIVLSCNFSQPVVTHRW